MNPPLIAQLKKIAIACFITSQATILISYWVALMFDHPKVKSCNPFFEGCLNITDAGIYSPEGYIFRGGMISACVLFIIWWQLSFQLLKSNTHYVNVNRLSNLLGTLGAICLIVATAVLVPPRSAINWDVHVSGAILFFLLSFAGQVCQLFVLTKQSKHMKLTQTSLKIKATIVGLQGLMITTFLILEWLSIGDAIVNAIEWWLALLIGLYYLAAYWDK